MAISLFEKGLCKDPTLGFPFIKGLSPMNEMKSILQYDYFLKFLQVKTSLLEKVFYKYSTNFHTYQMSVTCTSSPPPPARKSCKTDKGVSYRIHSMHKKKMAADKSKIYLQIFYEALKGSGRLEGTNYWGGDSYRILFFLKYFLTYL